MKKGMASKTKESIPAVILWMTTAEGNFWVIRSVRILPRPREMAKGTPNIAKRIKKPASKRVTKFNLPLQVP
jgi:hypothetical protein